MRSWRLPPTFIPITPSSHPLITWPAPSRKSNGLPVPIELSHFFSVGEPSGVIDFDVLPGLRCRTGADFDVPVFKAARGLRRLARDFGWAAGRTGFFGRRGLCSDEAGQCD